MAHTLFDTSIRSEKNDHFSESGRPSKTVRKFTDNYVPKWLPEAVSINIDWYACTATCGLPEPEDGKISYQFDTEAGHLTLLYLERGTQMYKYSYQVIWDGEIVGNLHTHSRNPKFVKEGKVKFELSNNVLYSSEWLLIKSYIFEALQMENETIGRLDIAIDGCNHLPIFLNGYIRQKPTNKGLTAPRGLFSSAYHNERVEMKGRARMGTDALDKKSKMFHYFKVGSRKGHKYITIYNKTKELEVSGKEYIRSMWERCGLDLTVDNFRCELRMDSQAIGEIADLDITRLWEPHYLLQIFRTHTENFFQFVKVKTDSNISRATVIDLFQFKKLLVNALSKVPRTIVRGFYKAKMLVHQAASTIMMGYTSAEQAMQYLHTVSHQIDMYHLDRWYRRKLPEWRDKYMHFFDAGQMQEYKLLEQLVRT